MPRALAALSFIVVIGLGGGGASAEPLMGPVTVTASNPGDQFTPAVAWDAEHLRWLAVWSQDNSGFRAIVGRIVNIDGYPLGNSFFISQESARNQYSPEVVYDPDHDRFLVVWEREYTVADYDIVGRFVPWNGPDDNLQAFAIDDATTTEQAPALGYAPFPVDEFMVVYHRRTTPPAPPTINARLLAGDGTFIGSTFDVVGDTSYGRQYPRVAWNEPAGRFLVVYERYQTTGDLNIDVYAASLSYSGTVFSPDLGIQGYAVEESQVDVAACDGSWLVVWKSDQGALGHPLARPVAGDLTLGTTVDLSATGAGYNSWPAAGCNPHGVEFFVTWQKEFSTSHTGVAGAFVSPQDGLVDSFNVNAAPFGDDRDYARPAVSVGSYERRALVVWEADREDLAHVDLGDRWVDMALFSGDLEIGNTTRWSATVP